jgi:hypothetical protein
LAADTFAARASGARRALDWEWLAEVALLSAVLVIGLVTAADVGTTVDEFNTEPYGRQALAWYLSGFRDDALFHNAEWIHLYGPWFQALVAAAQSVSPADPLTVRHALTFVVGLLGIAALGPLARLTIGRWAGLTAIVLCLSTGYLYGHLFFSPIDVPFLAAMTWATLAIVATTRRALPCWGGIVVTGLALGLVLGTRPGGVIAQGYFIGAIVLCGVELMTDPANRRPSQVRWLAVRAGAALVIAWLTALALWPWLQIGNPLTQFWNAFTHFNHLDLAFDLKHWGWTISTADLPWHYIPGQLLARLPEPFLVLLLLGFGFAIAATFRFASTARHALAAGGVRSLQWLLLILASCRGALVIAVAALAPALLVIALASTIYDGVRHILFVLPMLALVAGWGFVRVLPLLRRIPWLAAAATGLYLMLAVGNLVALHPLEYVAMNSLAGGTSGAYGRFELDYWSAAATPAIRRLEQRLDQHPLGHRPKVMVCIGWREMMAGTLFRRDWEITTSQQDADFLIETERFPCAQGTGGVLIDEVVRAGRSFARTYAMHK